MPIDGDVGTPVSAVPLPASFQLLLSGLMALLWARRRKAWTQFGPVLPVIASRHSIIRHTLCIVDSVSVYKQFCLVKLQVMQGNPNGKPDV